MVAEGEARRGEAEKWRGRKRWPDRKGDEERNSKEGKVRERRGNQAHRKKGREMGGDDTCCWGGGG